MRVLERILFVLLFIPSVPLMLLWILMPVLAGIFIGLPVAGIKFALTGRSGIDWFIMDAMDFVFEKYPMFMWLDRLERKAQAGAKEPG